MRTYLSLTVMSLSFAFWSCSTENQTSGESGLSLINEPVNQYIQAYDTLYPKEAFLVRKYVPLDKKIKDYLPKEIPDLTEGKSYKYPLPLENDTVLYCSNHRNYDFQYDKSDYCIARRDFKLSASKFEIEVKVSITVHNNDASVFKSILTDEEFNNQEKYKSLPSYKGYKYSLSGNSVELFLEPFIFVYLEVGYPSYEEGAPEACKEYFDKNWQKILDKIDLKKIDATYNSEGTTFKGKEL